eukprot:CAMPEP_0170480458 /NCGR_PEP_ID=MMETSP0208-20121228/1294_1 /TAXON_ID=197538 /ORGANISM="Strombidium inclinatum, Strain S3" /LENGTH=127 /DNA_ID=CAMNT_0010753017 /DNA_START=11 /DNA_END=394 /DNA_ORIENTATION=-
MDKNEPDSPSSERQEEGDQNKSPSESMQEGDFDEELKIKMHEVSARSIGANYDLSKSSEINSVVHGVLSKGPKNQEGDFEENQIPISTYAEASFVGAAKKQNDHIRSTHTIGLQRSPISIKNSVDAT